MDAVTTERPLETEEQETTGPESFYATVKRARLRGEKLVSTLRKKNFTQEALTLDVIYTPTETASLVGVSTETIRLAEKGGRLPLPKKDQSGRKVGYTFDDIQHMRAVFGKMPTRAEGDETVVISFPNYKGGAYKTSSSVHFAQGCAEMGYSVLFIDLDPQGTASHYFRRLPGVVQSDQTVGPTLLRQEGAELIHFEKTQWPNIDLVPACASLFIVEMNMTKSEEQLYKRHGLNSFEALRNAIDVLVDEHPDRWDLIVIDSPPALGHLTINSVVSSDICIVPTPAHYADYCSTIEFFRLLETTFDALEDDLGIDLRILITRFNSNDDESRFMAEKIKDTFKGFVLRNVVSYTGEVGKGLIKMRSIYEQPRALRGDRRAYKRARSIFDKVNQEILEEVVKPLWPSKMHV